MIPEFDESNESGDDHKQESNERSNNGAGSVVTKGVEFVTNSAPPCMGIPISPKLPHESRRAHSTRH